MACLASWMMLICFPQISYYTKDGTTFSFKALAMRLVLLGLIAYLFMSLPKIEQENRKLIVRVLLIIYLVGIALYLMLFPSAIISHRLTACFKAVEVVLIPLLLVLVSKQGDMGSTGRLRIQTLVLLGVLCVLMSVEMLKNVKAKVNRLLYWGNSAWEYPYISVFNKSAFSSERILIGDTVQEAVDFNDKER